MFSDKRSNNPGEVRFIDYEVAGFHPVLLDLAKPLYNDVFFETRYQALMPGKVNLSLQCRVSRETNTIVIEFLPRISSLAQAILDIKLRYLVGPLYEEVRKLGENLEDHVPLLSNALFLCAAVAKDFLNDEEALLSNFVTGMILRRAQN